MKLYIPEKYIYNELFQNLLKIEAANFEFEPIFDSDQKYIEILLFNKDKLKENLQEQLSNFYKFRLFTEFFNNFNEETESKVYQCLKKLNFLRNNSKKIVKNEKIENFEKSCEHEKSEKLYIDLIKTSNLDKKSIFKNFQIFFKNKLEILEKNSEILFNKFYELGIIIDKDNSEKCEEILLILQSFLLKTKKIKHEIFFKNIEIIQKRKKISNIFIFIQEQISILSEIKLKRELENYQIIEIVRKNDYEHNDLKIKEILSKNLEKLYCDKKKNIELKKIFDTFNENLKKYDQKLEKIKSFKNEKNVEFLNLIQKIKANQYEINQRKELLG